MGKSVGANYKQLFLDYMDSNGIRYSDRDEYCVRVTYEGENLKSIPIYVFFDKDGDPIIQMKCWEILNFKNNEAKAYVVCNELNAKYRWIRFYLDNDADIVTDCDAYIDEDTCGEECMKLVRRMVNITDEAYPVLAKALWA